MSAWTDRYVGLPWRDKGRGPDAFDCWGIVRHVVLEERGVELPMYDDGYTPSDRREIGAFVRGELPRWIKVEAAEARLFDVALLRVGGEPWHVGLVVGGGRFLHVMKGANTVLDRLDSPTWRRRIVGYLRWPELAA